MAKNGPDQYDVIITNPSEVIPLGDELPIRGTVLIVAREENVGRPKFGVVGVLSPVSSGKRLRREDVVTLDHPGGIRLSQYGITGGNVGDGVTIIHGGWSL
jgi:hypothetical protein